MIEFAIRERDQTVMSRSVVPAKPTHGLVQGAGDIQNALAFFDRRSRVIVEGVVIERDPLEEIRWWQLFRIAHDDHLAAAGDGADGFFGF